MLPVHTFLNDLVAAGTAVFDSIEVGMMVELKEVRRAFEQAGEVLYHYFCMVWRGLTWKLQPEQKSEM